MRECGQAVGLPLPAAAWVALLAVDGRRAPLVVVPHEVDALRWTEAWELFGGSSVFFRAPSLTLYQETEIPLSVRASDSEAFYRGLTDPKCAVVCTPPALFRRLPSGDAFLDLVIEVEVDCDLAMTPLVADLMRRGYRRADLVTQVGEFAVRGGVFDLFSPGYEQPLRLDFFGDTVESIRHFDPQTQRSEDGLTEATLLPLSLFPSGGAAADALADYLSASGAAESTAAYELIERLRERGEFAGWENYLGLVAEESVGLWQALHSRELVLFDSGSVRELATQHADQVREEYVWRAEQGHLAVSPDEVEIDTESVGAFLDSARLGLGGIVAERDTPNFQAAPSEMLQGQLPRFPREIETAGARGDRLILLASPGHHNRVDQLIERYHPSREGIQVVSGELNRGFRMPSAGCILFSDHQLFEPLRPTGGRTKRFSSLVSGLRDLKVGDYIVHADHGIGRFDGLRRVGERSESERDLPPILQDTVESKVVTVEVMELSYSDGRQLLVPLTRVDLVQKYSGLEGGSVRLDKLGGSSWSRKKARVRKGLQRLAGDLLKLYAERQLARTEPMLPDSDLQAQFDSAFDFEATPDQLDAVAAVRGDLEGERPMDRLLCGDVGFGKTEVAMRAAFKVVDSGHQVAVLAPTTILADQHLTTFRRRFAGFPVEIDMISRFRSTSEVKEIREKAAEGKVDLLIGTHRLLSKDVSLPKLGLLIIDEEQRFGVAQKERLRELKKSVHVLAMSATPVPRTLQLSLGGVRDMSLIETPPKDRMAIETVILPFAADLIREAIEHEIGRGGQVYYVYNKVEDIERIAAFLRETVPGIRLTIGHGQMDEGELARRMHAFQRGEYDVLLATTIIENGIDIPNVNTMLVHRADRFGLAQLYQLRGRVGRSDQLAYCYLLVPEDRTLTAIARKRLEAIREFCDLGAGFRVAARDLEIRGAGDLLGAEQSGHIASVGVETYMKMLEDAVAELRGEKVEEEVTVSIELPISSAISEEYISDANLRMEVYRRIATRTENLDALREELSDRFGRLPDEVDRLLRLSSIQRLAEGLRVQSISTRRGALQVSLRRDAKVEVEELIRFVSENPGSSFSPNGVLSLEGVAPADWLTVLEGTLRRLSSAPDDGSMQDVEEKPSWVH